MKNGLFLNRVWKVIGLLPVAAFLILMLTLATQGSTAVFESPILLASLNTIFLCAIPLVIAVLFAKSYQTTGDFAFLIMGAGLVFFGVSSLYAGWVMPLAGGPNPTVTLHNLGCAFAGICQFVGVHFFMQELAGVSKIRKIVIRYEILYAGIFVLVTITAALAFGGNLPVFFDPLTGASLLRQLILGGAIGLFVVAGGAFIMIYVTTKSDFVFWYGTALWLIAIGLTCVLLQREVGSALGWTGRGAQYIGCIYFIFAFVMGQRELTAPDSFSSSRTGWSIWPYFEQRVAERTGTLVQINEALLKEIAERKLVEETLRESEEKWRSLVNASPDFIALHDPEGRYLFLNHYAEGFTEKDVIGTSLYLYLLPESVELFRSNIENALNTWTTQFFDYTAFGDHGVSRTYEGYLVPLRGKNQEIIILSVSRDVTERTNAEEALRQSRDQLHALTTYWQAAFEAEKTRIAREIHDEFGQSMTALKMDLTWLSNRLPEEDERSRRIQGMNTLVDESIALMRRIATELRPNMLDDLGLNAVLEWQAKEFSNRSGIPCKVALPEQDLHLDPALSTSLFRIFQEALTNVARHAHATQINITLQCKNQALTLTIEDNGRGISETELEDPHSLGLLGLHERAAQWGGDTMIKGVAGKGTIVTVRIPLLSSSTIEESQ